jgi:hypothetical protein
MVSGTVVIAGFTSIYEHGPVSLNAEAYMDTVSAIRGNQGRQPLPINDRIYFMKKLIPISNGGKFSTTDPLKFSFTLEPSTSHPLIDAYVGVDFSIVYKVSISIKPKDSTTKQIDGSAQFYCMVAGSGIDPAIGKKYVPQQFSLSHDTMPAPAGQKLPKFKFSGQISSINCCFNEPFDGFLIC